MKTNHHLTLLLVSVLLQAACQSPRVGGCGGGLAGATPAPRGDAASLAPVPKPVVFAEAGADTQYYLSCGCGERALNACYLAIEETCPSGHVAIDYPNESEPWKDVALMWQCARGGRIAVEPVAVRHPNGATVYQLACHEDGFVECSAAVRRTCQMSGSTTTDGPDPFTFGLASGNLGWQIPDPGEGFERRSFICRSLL